MLFRSQSGVSADAEGSSLQTLLRGKPRPERDRDEDEKALAIHRSGAKYGSEDEVIHGKQRERMQQCPCEAADASEVARKELAPEKIKKQSPMAREARGESVPAGTRRL